MRSARGSAASGRRAARWLLLGLGVVAMAPACATKKDLKLVRDEMLALQAHQDSLFNEVQRQNRLLLDTLRTSFDIQRDAAGETSHRFAQLEMQLDRTEEMLQQMQLLVSDLMDRLDRQAAMTPPMVVPMGGVDTTGAAGSGAVAGGALAGEAAEAYDAGMQKMAEGAYTTARAAFLEITTRFPGHPLAPNAQYQIAQTYASEGDPERAISEFEKVEAQWPGSTMASDALLRAGIIAEELGDRTRARSFYETIRRRYPGTEAYREAMRRLGGPPG